MDTKKNLTVNKTIELFRKEQGQMEANSIKLTKGETLRIQQKKQKENARISVVWLSHTKKIQLLNF